MEDLTMFERLLTLPIFQGMTMQEISEALAHVRLDFVNYQSGDEIVVQEEPCKNLICIINGEVSSLYHDPKGRFIFSEELPSTRVIEPYNMFGMYQKYSRDYMFQTDGVTLSIERKIAISHVFNSNIVKINMLNIVSNKYQQMHRMLTMMNDDTVEEKITKFILSISSIPKGRKELQIKMQELANIVHETRLNVSKTLNDMNDRGLLRLQRSYIEIPNIQELKIKI